ncbi:MAG: FAD-dependent oxidoreductase, partial [Trueperaceae bacterium]
ADGPDGLWAVGRSAGYDPIAHSSVRVVPMGIAIAEGVGVAAALLQEAGGTPRERASDASFASVVRRELRRRGAYLPEARERAPVGPVDHPHHGSYRTMLSRGLALGGYANAPDLDAQIPATSHLYLLANVAQRFFVRPQASRDLVASFGGVTGPATAETVAPVQRSAACRLDRVCPDDASPERLRAVGLWPGGVPTFGPLTRGQSYALAEALVRAAAP